MRFAGDFFIRWLLNREALASGYASAAIKGDAPKGVDEIYHTAYRGGEAVPDAHFNNKIRKLLGEMPNADLERVAAIKNINELTPDESLYIINKFRETRGIEPIYTINEVLETYASKGQAAIMEFPGTRPLTALPESEMADLARLAKSTDPQVKAAAQIDVAARTWIAWENDQNRPSRLTLRLLREMFPDEKF